MTAAAILSELRNAGAKIRLDGDRLIVEAPKGIVDESLWEYARERKAELLEELRRQQPAPDHAALVDTAFAIFAGAVDLELTDVREEYFLRFGDLARRIYPALSRWDRLAEGFRALARIISELVVRGDRRGELRARYTWDRMEKLCSQLAREAS